MKAAELNQPMSNCRIVALGASAGGLEAFQLFFKHMPANSGMAFVLIQHLDPTHPTLMPELLTKHTSMPVREASDNSKLEPNHVYVIPPNAALTLEDCSLKVKVGLRSKKPDRGAIDHFFCSMAADQGSNVIAVILSGCGEDGMVGLKTVKENGGITLAQSADSAKYPNMPRSAALAGFVDYVLPIEEMPAKILGYSRFLDELQKRQEPSVLEEIAQHLGKILPALREKSGHDFSRYKQSTLVRRIHRRMQVTHVDSVPAYVDHLQGPSKEGQELFKDLLIGVTQFFRDPEAFESLQRQVIPALFTNKGPEPHLRIWVPGCASGEEAYSLAILLAEHATAQGIAPKVQIFATDLDLQSLEFARKGRYSEDIQDQVSDARLKRFFVKRGSAYEVSEELRAMCVFSPHNLIKDPPFSRLDLLSCRNLLIYLEADLQKKLLPFFHYALNPSGFLFLGPSENVASRTELFRTVDKRHRLFQRKPAPLRTGMPVPILDSPHENKTLALAAPQFIVGKDQNLTRTIERVLLEDYAPASVIINEQADVLYFSGRTSKFLEQSVGVPTNKILNLARKGLRLELRSAIHKAITTRQEVIRENVTVQALEDVRLCNLIVRPLTEVGKEAGLFIVIFQEIPRGPVPSSLSGAHQDLEAEAPLIQQLEHELKTTKEDLQTTIEELETSNEELKSANEELLSMNEELQSTNEELQTSKEELQSVNDQLQRKVEELDDANADLQNLFQSTPVPTIFLDTHLRIRRFTPAFARLATVFERDSGRFFIEAAPRFASSEMLADLAHVLRTLEPKERQLTFDGIPGWFITRIIPYRCTDQGVQGVVVTFLEITELKRAEEQSSLLASIVQGSQDAIIGQTVNGTVTSWNAAAERMYGFSAAEIIGHSVSIIVPADRSSELPALYKRLQKGETPPSIETVRVRKDQQKLEISLTVSAIQDWQGVITGFSSIARDITDRKRAEAELRRSQQLLSDFVENATEGLHWVGPDGTILWANKAELDSLGYAREEYVGRHIAEFHVDQPVIDDILQRLSGGEKLESYEARLRCKDGSLRHVLINSNVYWENGNFVHTRCFTRDITSRKMMEQALQESQTRLNMALEAGRMGAWDWNIEKGCIQWSPGLEKIHGLFPKSFPGTFEFFKNEIHPEDRERVLAALDTALRDRSLYAIEYRIQRADKQILWLEARGRLHFGEDGRPLRMVGICMEVTARKDAEDKLREESRVLGILNDIGSKLAAELDLEKLVQAVTDAGTQVTGAQFGAFFYNVLNEKGESYTLYTISGVSREAFSKYPMPRNTALFGPTFRGEGIICCDDVLQDRRYGKNEPHRGMPPGHLPVRSYLAVPVVSRSGEVLGGLFFGHPEPGVFQERARKLVTGIAAQAAVAVDNARLYLARTRVEQSLRMQARVLESMAEGVNVSDENGIIFYTNAADDAMFGYGPGELIGKHVSELNTYGPEENQRIVQGIIAELRSVGGWMGEFSNRRKDGTHFTTLARITALESEGRKFSVCVQQDITEEKKKETALRSAEAQLRRHAQDLEQQVAQRTSNLKQTLQSLEGVCYTIAHDLRSPLRSIQSFTGIIRTDYAPQLDAEGRLYADKIVAAASRMDTLIHDLLEFARLTHAPLPVESLALSLELKEVLQHLDHEITHHNAAVVVQEPLPVVLANRVMLEQVLTNLMVNALKFVGPGTQPRIEIRGETAGNLGKLYLKDNGIGIAAEHKERIFELFQRLHSNTAYPGTGVGLAIVRKGLERMNGRVSLESAPGEGSCFCIELPLANQV
ncbi:MAG: Chemotaxis protein methyltransferase CheR [Verrucomicrobiales bacterium]|nr:Chemotaxis protein methyltransferase CheR [Verrucomicrobiales bacterium]